VARSRGALLLSLTWALACAPGVEPSGSSGPLLVAAASDLTDALPDVVGAFRRRPEGFEVRPAFGSSGQLARQVEAGAPFDVFLSANEAYVKGLADRGLVEPGSVRPYAVGSLVLAVHPSAAGDVAGLADLEKPGVKAVAVANPEFAPYGIAARQALSRAGLWDRLASRLATAETVRQALQFVRSGNADAGLVGRSSARGSGLKVVEVPPDLYDPIVQSLGVVAGSPRKARAEAFVGFLLGPEGREVLASHGFGPPPGRAGGAR
jgi:molybdate transport system substrate-binding protein